MNQDAVQTLVSFFKAMADTSRLRLVGHLAQGERSVDELATLVDLKAPTVSHHLGKLRRLGLVHMRRDANLHYYALNEDAFTFLKREVLETLSAAGASPNDAVDPFERKVMQTFFIDGRLTSIPAQRKKRDVILRHLATLFEFERDYPEKEVNAVLSERHPDVATLRRELVGAKLMAREKGVYRRV